MTDTVKQNSNSGFPNGDNTPSKPDKLIVMNWTLSSSWGSSFKEAISDTFSAKTGIPVQHIENIGLSFPQSLFQALENKERPPFDLIYGNVIPAIQLAKAGYCTLMNEEEMPILKELHPRAKPDVDTGSSWPFVNLYVVRYAMMFRDSCFPNGKPASWNAMLDPKFKGRVSIYPGGKGFYPIMHIMGGGSMEDILEGRELNWEFVKSLKANVGKMGYNKEMTEYIRNGEIDLFFTCLTNIRQWKEDGIHVSWTIPHEGTADCVDSLVIPAFLPDNVSYWAKQFTDHAMTKEVQRDFCHRLGTCPMYPGIEPPEDMTGDPAYPKAPDDFNGVLFLPDSVTEKYEQEWMNEFDRIML